MIIGFDASRAFSKNRTGTENYSYQLLLNLAKIDHKNSYKVFIRGRLAGLQGLPLQKFPPNFKFIPISLPRLWTQVGLSKQTFFNKLGVLFIPSHTLPLVRKPGLKTVVTVHDLGAEYLPKMHQLKQKLYLKFMTRHQLKSATHLIAVSEATKNDLIKKVKLSPKKISVIYEGYNKNLFHPVQNNILYDTLKQFDLSNQQYFLFIGTIQPRKNIERLIQAYAQYLKNYSAGGGKRGALSSARNEARTSRWPSGQDPLHQEQDTEPLLVLVGSKGWLSKEIYELPKKLGIEGKVKFLGYVPDEQLPALYCGTKAFLFPSLFEGFGLPVLEAMAVGCPVLTSNLSSLPEVAGKAALKVNPYSVGEISKGISSLTTNHELTDKLTKLGFDQVKKFSWEKCAKETLGVLEKLG